MRLDKWETFSKFRENNEWAMNGGTGPVAVGMPPNGSFLVRQNNFVSEICPWFDWALRHVVWPIRPWIPWLLHSMPVIFHI